MKKFDYKSILIILAIGIVVSLIPYKTTIVPEWKLRVVDEQGVPYRNHNVGFHCENYSLRISCSADDSPGKTDDGGYVIFPESTITMSLARRLVLTISSYLLLLAHGSVGTVVSVDSNGPLGYKRLEYDLTISPPREFVIESK